MCVRTAWRCARTDLEGHRPKPVFHAFAENGGNLYSNLVEIKFGSQQEEPSRYQTNLIPPVNGLLVAGHDGRFEINPVVPVGQELLLSM